MAGKPGVYGAKGVSAAFREMSKLIGRPVDAASRKALRPILQAAKANTPHARLKKALVIKKDRRAPKARPTHMVGGDPKNPDFRLLHLVEFDTKPHENAGIFAGTQHPGTTGTGFLTKAFEAEGPNSIKAFGKELGPEIEKQAARLAKKHGRK